jgi:hypothetical protein
MGVFQSQYLNYNQLGHFCLHVGLNEGQQPTFHCQHAWKTTTHQYMAPPSAYTQAWITTFVPRPTRYSSQQPINAYPW